MLPTEGHPFLQGLSKYRGAPPSIIVIFGASGDLTARKLIPAIYNLGLDDLLPAEFHLIGVGRTALTDEAFRTAAAAAVRAHSRRALQDDVWTRIAAATTFLTGSYEDPEVFARLRARIDELEHQAGRAIQVLFYISTPPSVYAPILRNLGGSGLAARQRGTALASKVVIEKPFGRDLDTARELNRVIAAEFGEPQVFRIDHYLGKETVQDLLVQRFANAIFEPLCNRNFVECVQITVAEDGGVGSRAGYYEQSGALRDMIQNHTMQLLSLAAMEPPVSLDPEAIRDEKVKLLRAVQAVRFETVTDVARAQYTEGVIGGAQTPGYRQEPGVAPESTTETYAALRLFINNWRWEGVPFYLRSGKRMARRVSEIAIQFKAAPGRLFADADKYNVAPNTLTFQIQPDEGLTVRLNTKIPGLETRTQPVRMHFRASATFGSNTPEAYERLVLDAVIGDGTLFIRGDETETSWRLFTPVLEYWQAAKRAGLDVYPAGSWGPPSADRLLSPLGHEWRKP